MQHEIKHNHYGNKFFYFVHLKKNKKYHLVWVLTYNTDNMMHFTRDNVQDFYLRVEKIDMFKSGIVWVLIYGPKLHVNFNFLLGSRPNCNC